MKRMFVLAALLLFIPAVCSAAKKTASAGKVATAKTETKSTTEQKTVPSKTTADDKAEVKTKTSTKTEKKSEEKERIQTMTFRGEIDSVALGDAGTGIPPAIILVGEDGNKELFTIEPKTSISVKGGAIGLSQVKPGTRAVIEYVVKPVQGFTAVSIRLVE